MPVDLNQKRRSLQDGNHPRLHADNHYMTHTAGTGSQGIGLLHGRQGLTRPEQDLLQLYSSGDHLFSGDRREILEETSLADFLRVLTNLHNRVGERLVAEDFKPKSRKLGTASLTPPKVNSLLDLFPAEPEPPKSPKRKFSLMPNIFIQGSRKNSVSPPNVAALETDELTQTESSNLKRLGRFLLRSYSLTPKTDSNPDVSSFQRDSYRLKNRKKFSIRPGGDAFPSTSRPEPDNQDTNIVNCQIRIQIDSPESTIHPSDEPFSFVRSNTMDQVLINRFDGQRRGSSPASVIDLNPTLRERFRPATSSESILTPTGSRRFPVSPRLRPGSRYPHPQGESCSAKRNLSDVKENSK